MNLTQAKYGIIHLFVCSLHRIIYNILISENHDIITLIVWEISWRIDAEKRGQNDAPLMSTFMLIEILWYFQVLCTEKLV